MPRHLSLYAITDRRIARGGDVVRQAVRLLEAGVTWLQVREKDLPARRLHALVRLIVAGAGGDRVLVNDRVDVALAAGAAGVHLTTTSVSPRDVRRIAPGLVVAASTHTAAEALEAARAGADFLVFGPVFSPRSKTAAGPPAGIAALRAVAARVPIPVYALGGVTEETLPSLLAAGVRHVAGISLFMGAASPRALLRRISDLPGRPRP